MSSASQASPLLDCFQETIFDILHVQLTDIFKANATGQSILAKDGRLEIFVSAVEITAEGLLKVRFSFNDEYRFVWRGGQFSDLFLIPACWRGE